MHGHMNVKAQLSFVHLCMYYNIKGLNSGLGCV